MVIRTIEIEEELCLREQAKLEAIARIACDAPRRRELLWLRAMEVEDDEMARDLEGVDPDLAARMAGVLDDLARANLRSPRERREWFARRWHDCHERYIREVVPYVDDCTCSRCTPCGEA